MSNTSWQNPISSPWKILNVPSEEEFLKKFVLKEPFEFFVKKGDVKKTISIQVTQAHPASKDNSQKGVWDIEGLYFVGHIDTKNSKGCLVIQNSFMDSLDS